MKQILAIFFVIALFNGCYYDNVDELHPAALPCDTTGTVSFANDILPIMLHSCGSGNSVCHYTNASSSSYGLGTYSDLINCINVSNTFLKTITHDTSIPSSKWMPKNSTAKIDDCGISKIERWLNDGKKNN